MAFNKDQFGKKWRKAFDYIESVVDGSIVSVERQARWRPAFFIDLVDARGETVSVYFRGARPEYDNSEESIKRDYNILRTLEKNGIEVPHIYGLCESPLGIVMAKAQGKCNLGKNADDPGEVRSVMHHYMSIMARLHKLPVSEFEAIGIPSLSEPDQLAWGDSPKVIANFRKLSKRPEPALEFILSWLQRNQPTSSSSAACLFCDSGQFLFDRGEVTAILDVEFGYIGDPHADLAGLIMRDISEPLGNLPDAIAHYEKCMGHSIDPRTVMYHAIRWGANTPMYISHLVDNPPDMLEYIQYLSWYVVYQRVPLELIAHVEGISLEAPEEPEPHENVFDTAYTASLDRLRELQGMTEDQNIHYKINGLIRLEEYKQRVNRYAKAYEEQELDDVQKLLGHRPNTASGCDAQLVELVKSGEASDAVLVNYFYRRLKRLEFLLHPVLNEMQDTQVQTLAL